MKTTAKPPPTWLNKEKIRVEVGDRKINYTKVKLLPWLNTFSLIKNNNLLYNNRAMHPFKLSYCLPFHFAWNFNYYKLNKRPDMTWNAFEYANCWRLISELDCGGGLWWVINEIILTSCSLFAPLKRCWLVVLVTLNL